MHLKKLLIAIGIATVALSCSKEQSVQTRENKLSFHAKADCSDEPMKDAAVGVLAGTRTLYLKSSFNKEIDLFWQDAQPIRGRRSRNSSPPKPRGCTESLSVTLTVIRECGMP